MKKKRALIDPQRKPRLFPYVRVSSQQQQMHNYSLPEQIGKIERYINFKFDREHFEWDGLFFQDVEAASRIKFNNRQSGSVIASLLQPGDHVIAYDWSRAFRDMEDWVVTMNDWGKRQIALHDLTLHLDTSTRMGLAFATMQVANNNVSLQARIDKQISTNQWKRERLIPVNRAAPPGWKVAGQKGHLRYEIDHESRAWFNQIVEMREVQGMGWVPISRWLMLRFMKARDLVDRRKCILPSEANKRHPAKWRSPRNETLKRWYDACKLGYPLKGLTTEAEVNKSVTEFHAQRARLRGLSQHYYDVGLYKKPIKGSRLPNPNESKASAEGAILIDPRTLDAG